MPAKSEKYLSAAGRRAAVEMMGRAAPERIEATFAKRAREVDESWARISMNFVINGMYSRGVLPTGVRELCAVAALTAICREAELESHIRIALRSNRAEHVREAILQMAVYAGVPAAHDGFRLFQKVMAEPEFAGKAKTRPLRRRPAQRGAEPAP